MAPELQDRHTRRQVLKGAGALVGLGAVGTGVGVAFFRSLRDGGGGQRLPSGTASGPITAEELADNVVSGGPGKDGIPAIDDPQFVPASAADFLGDEDVVFGLVHRGDVRAYPQPVVVWHEIINDAFPGERLSVTYCPLTGSVVAFRGRADGRPLTFGTTGNLVNSNLLMYDRETDSEWPQLFAAAISGSLEGMKLEEVPLVWTTWQRWREAHPDTLVLSTDTGFARSYGSDPYGSYTPPGGYYAGGGPIFPVVAESDRLPDKEVVVGVRAQGARVAIRKRAIEKAKVLPFSAGRTPLLAVWDDELATARVFVRRLGRRALRFRKGQFRDSGGSTWNAFGEAVAGPLAGARLSPASFLDAMWFSWYAFYPDTEVLT